MKNRKPADATFRNINALKKRIQRLEDWATPVSDAVAGLLYDRGLDDRSVFIPEGFHISHNTGKQEKNMAKKKGTKKGGKKGSC